MQKPRWPRVLAVVAVLLAPASIAGQQPEAPAEESGSVWDEVLGLYEKAKETGQEVPQDVYEWVRQDIRAVGDWEYRVVTLNEANGELLEAKLNELGAERWECIWIQPRGSQLRLILKRPVRSYLKQLPLSQLLKLIPAGDSGGE